MSWKNLPDDAFEAIYNPRTSAANPDAALARFTQESTRCHDQLVADHTKNSVQQDIRFDDGPLGTLDLYRRTDLAKPPLAIFVHGGYWRALDKADHRFIVPPLLDAGAAVANVNYDLCPQVTLDVIAAQIVSAVRFCHQHAKEWGVDPGRIVLIGHSAGAHLCARVLNQSADTHGLPADLVAGFPGICGVYEPQVILKISVNDQAQIDAATAQRNDCVAQPPGGRARVVLSAGGNEPPGWIDQTKRYAQTVRSAGLNCKTHVVEQSDHFTVLEKSFVPDSDALGNIVALFSAPSD